MAAMNKGFYLAAAIAIVGFAITTLLYMKDPNTGALDWRPFWATVAGIGLAIALDKLTEYFTSHHKAPVKEVSDSSTSGSATNILSGLALGMESSVWAVVVIALSIFTSVIIYANEPAATQFTAVLYGVALTGIGMLTLTGNTISMDSFGPISDNANGIGEMAGLEESARRVMDDLDATGNTTKAVTKGIAIGSAVIAAVALFGSYLTDVGKVQASLGLPKLETINVAAPSVFIGLLIGGAVALLVLVADHSRRFPRRRRDCRRGTPPVQNSRIDGRQSLARLCPRRQHFHDGRTKRIGQPGSHCRAGSDFGGLCAGR